MRGTIVLLLLAGALVFGLWWTSAPSGGGDGASGDPASATGGAAALEGRRVIEARELRFVRQRGTETLVVRHLEDGWKLVEPIIDLAAPERLESIANAYDNALLTPAKEAAEVTEGYLEQTGLAEPEAWIEFRYDDRDEPLRLEIGAPGPLGSDRFVRRAGAVYRAQHALLSVLQVNRDDLRARRVFSFGAADVHRVVIDRKAAGDSRETLDIRRVGYTYRLESPDVRLDPATVARFLQLLTGLRIDQFLPGAWRTDSLLGGPTPAPDVRLQVHGPGGVQTVELFEAGGGLTGRHVERGISFAVDGAEFATAVETPLVALRSRALLSFAVEDIESITVDPGRGVAAPMKLERAGEQGYRMAQPLTGTAAPTPVAELLSAIRRLGISQFVADEIEDPGTYGLGESAARVMLAGALAPLRDEIEIGRVADEDPAFRYVRRADERSVGLIDARIAEAVLRPWFAYVDLTVSEVAQREAIGVVRVLAVEGGEKAERAVFVRGADRLWHVGRDADAPARNLQETVVLMSDLEGVRAWPEGSFDGEALAEYEIRLERANGDALAVFDLVALPVPAGDTNTDRRAVARRPGRRVLIELSRRDAEDILALLDG
jgi:hypothetical protein